MDAAVIAIRKYSEALKITAEMLQEDNDRYGYRNPMDPLQEKILNAITAWLKRIAEDPTEIGARINLEIPELVTIDADLDLVDLSKRIAEAIRANS